MSIGLLTIPIICLWELVANIKKIKHINTEGIMKKTHPKLVKSRLATAIGIATLATVTTNNVYAQTQQQDAVVNEEVQEQKASQNQPGTKQAQQEKENELAIERITVTSSKRVMDMQELPQSVQALNTEQLERMGLRNFADYAKAIPSLSAVSTSPGRNEIVFRGISTGSGEWRTDSSVAVYLDEIPMTSAAQQVDPRMVDIERVEALPGPQGTLLGSSSQSGALRIITNKPDADQGVFGAFEIEGSTMAEGDPSYRAEGHINIPLIDNVLAVRVAGFSVKEGGYIDNVVGKALFTDETNEDVAEENFNTWEQDGFRVIGLWHVNDKWDAQLTYLNQKAETNGDWKYDPALGELDIVRFHNDIRTDDWWSTALTITGNLGFAELTLTSSHTEREVKYNFDSMVSDQLRTRAYGIDNINGAYNPAYYNTAYINGTVSNDQVGRRTTQEIRLTSMGESKFQWLMGAFYESSYDQWNWNFNTPNLESTPAWAALNYLAYSTENNYDNYAPGELYPLASTDIFYQEDFERTTDQLAVFGEVSYEITDKLTMLMGLRWFEYDRNRTEKQSWPLGLPFGNQDTGGIDIFSGKDSDMVKKLSASYKLDDDKMLYYTYSEGFRLGGYNMLRPNSVLPESYESDKLFNHEVGLKSEWWDNRFRVNISAFYMQWEDMQREIYDPYLVGTKAHANIGDAESIGVEANFTLQLTQELKLEGSYFQSDSEITQDFWFSDIFDDGVVPPSDDWLVATEGQDLAIAPDNKWWLGLEYTFANQFLGANWWIRYDHSYQGSQSHDWSSAQSGFSTIPSWSIANMSLGLWTDTDWTVTLTVNNLFDERAVNWIDDGNDELLEQYNIDRYKSLYNVVRPREVSLSFKIGF